MFQRCSSSSAGSLLGRCLALAQPQPRQHQQRRRKSTMRRRIESATTEFDLTGGRRRPGSAVSRQRVFGCGWPATGALGIARFAQPRAGVPMRQQVLAPARLAEFAPRGIRVLDCAAGYGYSLFACRRGSNRGLLLACGANTDGQLGLPLAPLDSPAGRMVLRPTPVRLPVHPAELAAGHFRILRLAAGRAHSLVVTSHGAWAFGNSAFGQCGRPPADIEAIGRLALPCPPEAVSQVVCGQDCSFLLTAAGQVYACGLGADGQLGLGGFDSADRLRPLAPASIDGPVAGLACRADTALALCRDGRVYGWGNSEYGQLGTDSVQVDRPIRLDHVMEPLLLANQRVAQVASAGSMCALLTQCGRVWVWGYGRLGLGPDVTQLARPRPIPEGLFGRCEFSPDTRVVSLEAGMYHFAAVTNKGCLFTWGDQRSGSLGLGHEDSQCFPLQVTLACRVAWARCGVDHTIICGQAFA